MAPYPGLCWEVCWVEEEEDEVALVAVLVEEVEALVGLAAEVEEAGEPAGDGKVMESSKKQEDSSKQQVS